MRNTLLFFLFLFFAFLAFAFFVKLPNKIKTESTVTTKNPPSKVFAPFSGKLSKIFKKDGDFVEQDELIVKFGTVANHKHIDTLANWLTNEVLNKNSARSFYDLGPLSLETLQQSCSAFQKNLVAYDFGKIKPNGAIDSVFQKLNRQQKELLSEVKEWQNKYLIKSTSKGKVYLPAKNREGQFLRTGEFICSIIPHETDQTIIANVTFLSKDQAVLIKPGTEAALHVVVNNAAQTIKARVEEVTPFELGTGAFDTQYKVTLSLPDKLKTNKGESIRFIQDMTISTSIETENLSLYQKLLH